MKTEIPLFIILFILCILFLYICMYALLRLCNNYCCNPEQPGEPEHLLQPGEPEVYAGEPEV